MSEVADRFMAMLATARADWASPEAVIAEMVRGFPGLKGQVSPAGAEAPVKEGDAYLLNVGGVLVTAMFVGRPVPEGTFDTAIATSFVWPQAARELGRHKAHVIVAEFQGASDRNGRVTAAVAVTLVASALTSLVSAIGVHWSPANTVVSADHFRRLAGGLAEKAWPLDSWVQFRFTAGADDGYEPRPTGLETQGAAALIGREIELEPASVPPMIVAERVLGTITYLLGSGLEMRDGDTLGISNEERIRVRHLPAGGGRAAPAYHLTIEMLAPAS